MKVSLGKENERILPASKEHKVTLEDDTDFKEAKQETQFLFLVSKEEIPKIVDFIKTVQILGVDNEAVKLMYKLRSDILNKIEEKKIDKIIDSAK